MMFLGWLGTEMLIFYAVIMGVQELAVMGLLVSFESLIF